MKLLGEPQLVAFAEKHADARAKLAAWKAEILKASWKKPLDIKAQFPLASFVGKDRVVFNICGNRYRLDARVSYDFALLVVERIGTHKQYDSWTF